MTSQSAAANPQDDSGNARSTEAASRASGRVFTYKDTAIVTPNSSIPRQERASRINLGQALGGRLSYQDLSIRTVVRVSFGEHISRWA
jgi:hypothetical protein